MAEESNQQKLRMTFTPNTIEHLGVRMYSTLPPVVAELIANSYDADATEVHIHLKDDGEKKISISDNGHGMSFDEINGKFLRIGRNRRNDEDKQTSPNGRKVIGKKGLGKLSFFGIAHEIEVQTTKDRKKNSFLMKWEDILSYEDKYKQQEYQPTLLEHDVRSYDENGTIIILKSIQRITDFDANLLADNLSKIFIIDPNFRIFVRHNDDHEILIVNERKYATLTSEVKWDIPNDVKFTTEYEKSNEIKGQLIATEKPISPNTNMRGITLFSRKKLVNMPEYFSDSTSSHFYSYLTGWLEVDFIDDFEEDVIGTNRQSLNWSHPDMIKLRKYLQELLRWLERDWREKRANIREEKISQATGINIQDWYGKLPEEIKEKVKPVVDAIVKDAELSDKAGNEAVKNFHEIVPEYPRYHWRHLHNEIKTIAEYDYINEKYFDAAEKASRLYLQRVKEKSGVDSGRDSNDVDLAFNQGTGVLMVTSCKDTTEKNIQNGQQLLSQGIVAGCRNPLTHNPEYQKKLVDTGLFTEKDCLDMLSIISHLFTRLDNAKKRTAESD